MSKVVRLPLAKVFARATPASFTRAMNMYAPSTERELVELEKRNAARKRQDEINEQEWKKMDFQELQ